MFKKNQTSAKVKKSVNIQNDSQNEDRETEDARMTSVGHVNLDPVQNLQQMSYRCPGIHGPGAKQNIEKRTFGSFLVGNSRAVIPLCQRRYCWHKETIKGNLKDRNSSRTFILSFLGWWDDVINGQRDCVTDVHCSGKVRVKFDDADKVWNIIDGQQRITTTLLLVAAIRDAIVTKDPNNERLPKLEQALYHDMSKVEEVKRNGKIDLREGQDLDCSRLLPSYSDRLSYFTLITQGILKDQTKKFFEDSFQGRSKYYFDKQLSKVEKISELEKLATFALEKMGMTLVEIINEINMAQVFLWFQEKAVFGPGGFLYNRAPGVDFEPCDLVRNLVVSSQMSQSIDVQERFYRQNWLEPIESKYQDPKSFSRAIKRYLEKDQLLQNEERHVSESEKKFCQAFEFLGELLSKEKRDSVETYGKFQSLIEQKMMALDKALDENEKRIKSALDSILSELAEFARNDCDK